MKYPVPDNEVERMTMLHSLRILDTGDDKSISTLCKAIKSIFATEMVVVSLVDENRQWFKCHLGLGASHTDREVAFCNYTICGTGIFEVTDARENAVFCKNPLVTGAPYVRYYCGAPISLKENNIGALCLIDTNPRPALPENMCEALLGLADTVAYLISSRKLIKDASGLVSLTLAKAS